jgi:solute:Na+ symporter, SSS family
MSPFDLVVFLGFITGVVALGLWQSRGEARHGEKSASDYFLAGRGLSWWLIGFSLIAANISTEQFVGMSGQAADWLGMAIASYEWMAAITLVVVGFLFLPTFLRCGIFTIPEFLEHRYGFASRLIMALATMVILVGVPTASVIFSGAKVISVAFQETTLLGLNLGDITTACWITGILAAAYVFAGGLKACAWADLIQGSALILGGGIIAYLAFQALANADPTALAATAAVPGSVTPDQIAGAGAIERFTLLNGGAVEDGGKLHMVRPASDPAIPWTALVVGLWIPNFFYWGLNQYIVQRTLGSRSLAAGQKGIVFAAGLKLIIPFVVVIPGILAYNLFNEDLQREAGRKNTAIVAEFESGAAKAYPFSDNFARTNPELAARVFAANAVKAGRPATPPPADPVELANANLALVNAAAIAGVPTAVRLVGYDYDAAFPTLLRNLLRPGSGLMGFVFAAIFGAVVSSLASMLNAASTIFAMDIWRNVRKRAEPGEFVLVGRICVVVFVTIACLIAPSLGRPEFGGIFTFIQEFQGFISPGILAVCLFGLLVPKAPRFLGWFGILLNAVLYGVFKYTLAVAFLDRMAICFAIVLAALTTATLLKPLPQPVVLPVNVGFDMTPSKGAKTWGYVVCAATVVLYVIFW